MAKTRLTFNIWSNKILIPLVNITSCHHPLELDDSWYVHNTYYESPNITIVIYGSFKHKCGHAFCVRLLYIYVHMYIWCFSFIFWVHKRYVICEMTVLNITFAQVISISHDPFTVISAHDAQSHLISWSKQKKQVQFAVISNFTISSVRVRNA